MRGRRRGAILLGLAIYAVTGCGLVLGIDEGRLVPASDAAVTGETATGGETGADTSTTQPPVDGGATGDATGDASTGCPRTTESVTAIADTFLVVQHDASDTFGTQTDVAIGDNGGGIGGLGLFRFDLGALVDKLKVSTTTLTLVLREAPGFEQPFFFEGGTMNVYPVNNDWDEGSSSTPGASWWDRRLNGGAVPWTMPGVNGADRGALVGTLTLASRPADASTPIEVPIGDFNDLTTKLGGPMTSQVSLLAVPQSTFLLVVGARNSVGHEPVLNVSYCNP